MATYIIGAVVLGAFALAIYRSVKNGKSGGCGGCSGCAIRDRCHGQKEE